MKKAIYFDMDGTLADFYSQPMWLAHLALGNTQPYDNATLLPDKEQFQSIIIKLKEMGYVIGVISWLGKKSTEDFKARVRQAKRNWLTRHLGDIFDEIHLVQYGTPKHIVATHYPSFLVDDNIFVNAEWNKHGGHAIDAKDIMNLLQIITE